ncbi:hypothetical protein REPUB_Repub11eG0045800 [Reevesia pubescens]
MAEAAEVEADEAAKVKVDKATKVEAEEIVELAVEVVAEVAAKVAKIVDSQLPHRRSGAQSSQGQTKYGQDDMNVADTETPRVVKKIPSHVTTGVIAEIYAHEKVHDELSNDAMTHAHQHVVFITFILPYVALFNLFNT